MTLNGIFIPTGGHRKRETRRWWEWIIVILIGGMAYGIMGLLFLSAL